MNQKFTLSSVEQCYICFFQISTIITMKKAKKKERIVGYDPQNRRSLAAKKTSRFSTASHGVSLRCWKPCGTFLTKAYLSHAFPKSSAAQGRTCGSLSTLCVRKASFRASPLRPTAIQMTLRSPTLPQNSWMNTKASAMPCSPPVFKGINEKTLDTTLDCLKDMLRNLESLSAEKATTESAMPSEKSARE